MRYTLRKNAPGHLENMAKYGPRSQAVSKPTGPSSAEDFNMIGDLLETVEQNPTSVDARWVLAEQYDAFGWTDAAAEIIREILLLDPTENVAQDWLAAHDYKTYVVTPSAGEAEGLLAVNQKSNDEQHVGTLVELGNGYKTLLGEAQVLFDELQAFQEMCGASLDIAVPITDIRAIMEGRLTSVVKVKPPAAARNVAERIKAAASPLDTACNDLEASARWNRSGAAKASADQVRDAVRKRADAIKAALPHHLASTMDDAWMHIEHEVLGKTYLNDSGRTMLGDPIAAIPRLSFWRSEDGYAWDMSELTEAIKANGGVMRNPLSKQLFSADDVRAIVTHPMGEHLAALRLRQKELTKGVRKDTISKLEQIAAVLLEDQSADAASSRKAVENFLLYTATLPEAEQNALKDLRVPAKDSHTGQPFDVTVGDAVADAKANRQCFHKTGDMLAQAAKWLANQKANDVQMPGSWS